MVMGFVNKYIFEGSIQKMKIKFISFVLIIACVFSMSTVSASAATTPQDGGEASVNAVIDRYSISASECQNLYDTIEKDTSWTNAAVSAFVNFLPYKLAIVTNIASIISQLNFNQTKKALKAGIESGKGCTVVLYDNASPYIYAN